MRWQVRQAAAIHTDRCTWAQRLLGARQHCCRAAGCRHPGRLVGAAGRAGRAAPPCGPRPHCASCRHRCQLGAGARLPAAGCCGAGCRHRAQGVRLGRPGACRLLPGTTGRIDRHAGRAVSTSADCATDAGRARTSASSQYRTCSTVDQATAPCRRPPPGRCVQDAAIQMPPGMQAPYMAVSRRCQGNGRRKPGPQGQLREAASHSGLRKLQICLDKYSVCVSAGSGHRMRVQINGGGSRGPICALRPGYARSEGLLLLPEGRSIP